MKNISSICFFLLVTSPLFSQYIPDKRPNVPERWYKEAVERLGKIYQAESEGRTPYLQKASAYANLGEPADSVFKYIDLALAKDSQRTCINLHAFESIMPNSKNGMYFGYVDSSRYALIKKRCTPIIKNWELSEKRKKEADYYNVLLDRELIKELEIIQKDDQSFRPQMGERMQKYGSYSPEYLEVWRKQAILDSMNLIKIEQIIKEKGYPGKSLVGDSYKEVAFMVIHHSNIEAMEKYLPILKEAYKKGEIDKGNLAFIIDRIYHARKGKQIFGTQQFFNLQTNRLENVPMADEDTIKQVKKDFFEN